MLADPIFSHHCSPVQFAGPARVRPAPLQADALPDIDAVVISHNHYDHLDINTVRALAAKEQEREAVWYVHVPYRTTADYTPAYNVEKELTLCQRTKL